MQTAIDYKRQIVEDIESLPEDTLREVARTVHDIREDKEDLDIALERLRNPGKRWSMDEVEKVLGLES